MDSFSLNIAAWVNKAKGRGDLVVRKVSLDMFTRVIRRSPVYTGRFRANWQTSIGAPMTATTLATDKSGSMASARVAAITGSAVVGQTIFMTNSLPYARPLEYGSSTQAPSGMVRITVQEFQQVVNKAVGTAKTEKP